MARNDHEDEYAEEKPICCSVSTFLWTNYLWSVISVGLLVLGVVGIVVETGVLVVLPPAAYFFAIGIGSFGILVILMGIVGQKQSIELCFLLYILFVALGLIAQTLAYCYLLLYANDVSTISSLDNAAINAQVAFESNLVDYALDEPAKWKETQDKLKCCGIDFELFFEQNDKVGLVESGNLCAQPEFDAELDDLRDEAIAAGFDPAKDGEFQPAKDSEIIGTKTGFFCKDKISIFMVDNTPVIAGVLVFVLLVQIAALVSASRMYWVPEYLGGWQFDESELEEVARRKGLELPRQEDNQGFRGVANRLSFRLKNAVTYDPEVGQEQGFLKRLSMKRNPQMFGQPGNQLGQIGEGGPVMGQTTGNFGGPGPRPPNGAPPGMFESFKRVSNRLSSRMMQPFGGGMMSFGRPSQPSGPPPGFGQPGAPPGPGPNFGSPAQPNSPPPGNYGMGSPASRAPPAPRNVMSAPKRISARLQQGLGNMGIGKSFGFGAPQPGGPPAGFSPVSGGPPPPSFGGGMGAVNKSNRGGLPQPNAGFGANEMSGPPPPNTFKQYGGSGSGRNLVGGGSNTSLPTIGGPGANGGAMGGPRPTQNSYGVPPPAGRPSQSSYGKKPSSGGMKAPKMSFGGGGAKKSSAAPKMGGGGGALPAGRGGLLAQIQMGKQLKHAQTNDRSAPKI